MGRRAWRSRDKRCGGRRASPRATGSSRWRRRSGITRARRHVAGRPAALAQAAAEVGVFPVEEVSLVEAADQVERLPPDEHRRAHDPVHGRALDARRPRDPRRADSGARPRRTGRTGSAGCCARTARSRRSGSPRALACTEPSALRSCGAAIAHSGWRSSVAASVANAPGCTSQSGFSSHSRRRPGRPRRLVDRRAEPDVPARWRSAGGARQTPQRGGSAVRRGVVDDDGRP